MTVRPSGSNCKYRHLLCTCIRYVHAVKAAAAAAGGIKTDASNGGNSGTAAASATAAAADGVIQLPESGVTDEEVLLTIALHYKQLILTV
jgi:hypothetical protein